jgi:phosphinothricin acetyltransferase
VAKYNKNVLSPQIAELDNKVVGYTYASKYRSRSAYKYTIEDSI